MSAKHPECWAAVTRIAWPVAARVLHWSPDRFWAATPAELVGALADPAATDAPLARDEMTRLMAELKERDDG